MKLHRVILCILFLTITVFAHAQVKKVIADKIVGAVGDKYILKSDIDNAIQIIKDKHRDKKELLFQQLVRY